MTRSIVDQRRSQYTYRTKPRDLVFHDSVALTETRFHSEIRTTLVQIVQLALQSQAAVGSAQPIYWNAADPSQYIFPDLFVRVGGPECGPFESWKVWERGSPHIIVEIVSDNDASEIVWKQSLARFHQLGVEEVVRFDPVAPTDALRVWDRINNTLLERTLDGSIGVESAILGLFWVVLRHEGTRNMLRLAKCASGKRLLPTPVEHAQRTRERAERRLLELESALRNKPEV